MDLTCTNKSHPAGNDELSRFYGYIPNLAVCIIILSLFFISGGEYLLIQIINLH